MCCKHRRFTQSQQEKKIYVLTKQLFVQSTVRHVAPHLRQDVCCFLLIIKCVAKLKKKKTDKLDTTITESSPQIAGRTVCVSSRGLRGCIHFFCSLYGFCLFMAPFFPFPYIARHCFVPTVKPGKYLISNF